MPIAREASRTGGREEFTRQPVAQPKTRSLSGLTAGHNAKAMERHATATVFCSPSQSKGGAAATVGELQDLGEQLRASMLAAHARLSPARAAVGSSTRGSRPTQPPSSVQIQQELRERRRRALRGSQAERTDVQRATPSSPACHLLPPPAPSQHMAPAAISSGGSTNRRKHIGNNGAGGGGGSGGGSTSVFSLAGYHRRMARLEAENAQLRQVLADITGQPFK